MGRMGRLWLHDDVPRPGVTVPEQKLALVQDPPVPDARVNPLVTVKVRERTGWDGYGDAEYAWSTVLDAVEATVWDQRDELSDLAGRSTVKARLVVLYTGEVQVTETAVVVADPGGLFRVESVSQTPDRLEMTLFQVDA